MLRALRPGSPPLAARALPQAAVTAPALAGRAPAGQGSQVQVAAPALLGQAERVWAAGRGRLRAGSAERQGVQALQAYRPTGS